MTLLFISEVMPAIKRTLQHWRFLLLAVFVDLGFFYSLTTLHVETFMKIQTHMDVIMTSLQNATANIDQADPETLMQLQTSLGGSESVLGAYHELLKLLAIFFALLFVIWLVFQGVQWLIAHRISAGKESSAHLMRANSAHMTWSKSFVYARRFLFVTIFWFILFIADIFLFAFLTQYTSFAILPLVGQTVSSFVFALLLFLLGYVSMISYALPSPSLKQTVLLCWRSSRHLFPAYMTVLVAWFALGSLAFTLFPIHYLLSLAWVFVVVFPLFTISRTYFVLVVNAAQVTGNR